MSERRGLWFLLTGLVVGIGIGLLIAWVISPVEYVDTTPASLRADFKDDYRYMIASAYMVTGDLGRAQARLTTLADTDPIGALGEQAQRMLAQSSSMDKVQVLANLSEALRAQPTAQATTQLAVASASPASPSDQASLTPEPATPTSTPQQIATSGPGATPILDETPTPLPTPIFTATPRPTRTPTNTPGAPYNLAQQATFCEPSQPALLQIYLVNSAEKPAPGEELVITWFGGEEHIFTGLKPELGRGYADFVMSAGVEYALSVSSGATRVTGLSAPSCTDSSGKAYPGGVRLEFQQP
jgi:hypothetical protein